MTDPHEVLGIEPGSDPATIQRAFKRRAKETHPDLGGSARAFREVHAAYEMLREGDGEWPSSPAHDRGPVDSTVETQAGGQGSRVEYLDYDDLWDDGYPLTENGEGWEHLERASTATGWGEFSVGPDETLLQAAERNGCTWPYSCRGGACANCAVAVIDGEMSMPVNHILPDRMLERGIRLSCVGAPLTPHLKVLFNVKRIPALDELRLPPQQEAEPGGLD